MRSMAMVVIPALVVLVATMAEAQYGGVAATGASADMTGTLHRGAAAQAAPAVTLPTVASTTTTSLAAALPTTAGRRGLRGEGSPAMATADSPATTDTTTGVRATTPATTMAMGITLAMAMATTLVMAMATATTTTGAVASETVSVLPTSSAATFAQATSAPDQTTMVDQIIWPLLLIDIYLEI